MKAIKILIPLLALSLTASTFASSDDSSTAKIAGGTAGGGAAAIGAGTGAYFLAKHLKNRNAANASGETAEEATSEVGEDSYEFESLGYLKRMALESEDTPASTTLSNGTDIAVTKNGKLMSPEEYAVDEAAQKALQNDEVYGEDALSTASTVTEEVADLI